MFFGKKNKDKETSKEINKTTYTNESISEPSLPTDSAITTNDTPIVTQNIDETALTYKEFRALRKAKYDEKFSNNPDLDTFVLRNFRTGQIVELKAFSSYQACNIIGWKPNQVRVIKQIKANEQKSKETK